MDSCPTSNCSSNQNQLQYNIVSIPEKGQGLAATEIIPLGQRILAEKPLFVLPGNILNFTQKMENLVRDRLREHPQIIQNEYLSLQNNMNPKYPLQGIFLSNALPLGYKSNLAGLFPTASLINHDCQPNAHVLWNVNIQRLTVHAIREIVAGEEITAAYVMGTFEHRQGFLRDCFAFDCVCDQCSKPFVNRVISDKNMRELSELEGLMGCTDCILKNPLESYRYAHRMFQVLNKERITDMRVANFYISTFQIVISHGDLARGRVFAQRALRASEICEGRDSPTSSMLTALVLDPSSHHMYGITGLWKTTEDQIPNVTNRIEFEKWLWRYDVHVRCHSCFYGGASHPVPPSPSHYSDISDEE